MRDIREIEDLPNSFSEKIKEFLDSFSFPDAVHRPYFSEEIYTKLRKIYIDYELLLTSRALWKEAFDYGKKSYQNEFPQKVKNDYFKIYEIIRRFRELKCNEPILQSTVKNLKISLNKAKRDNLEENLCEKIERSITCTQEIHQEMNDLKKFCPNLKPKNLRKHMKSLYKLDLNFFKEFCALHLKRIAYSEIYKNFLHWKIRQGDQLPSPLQQLLVLEWHKSDYLSYQDLAHKETVK